MKKLFISTLELMAMTEEELMERIEAAGFDLKKPISTEPGMGGNTYIQEEERKMNLKDFLFLQSQLDDLIMARVKDSGRELTENELLSCRFLGLFTETGEFCNEISSHRYWKQNHQIDYKKALTEYIDCLFFMLSIANLLGYTAEEIQEAYMEKWNINVRRQKEGY